MEMESRRNQDIGDASFSAYLTRTKESNIGHRTSDSIPIPVRLKPEEEREIGVFGAEKYFSMKLDEDGKNDGLDGSRNTKNSSDFHRARSSKGRLMGTPSVSSESSWNSQTTLLRSQNRQIKRNLSSNERWAFTGFACNGTCSDKKSVSTCNFVQKKEFQEQPSRALGDSVLFGARKRTPNSRIQAKDDNFMLPSGSLETFTPRAIKKEDIEMNLERKLSVLTWDAIPNSQKPQKAISSSSSAQKCESRSNSQVFDDVGSDASSDLFEIDNLYGHNPKLSCQYEPSESSVEWSVVAASAANVADFEEKKVSEPEASCSVTKRSDLASTSKRSILSCKSHKAVQVSETVHKRQLPRTTTTRKLKAEI